MVCFFAIGDAFNPCHTSLHIHSKTSTRLLLAEKTTNNDPYLAQKLVFRGMDAFRNGQVDLSIQLFDQAEALKPSLTPYLWQRGLSYYYADRFAEASQQFRTDVQVNPLDVEEIVWDIGSQMRLRPNEPPNAMTLPPGKRDRRKIMAKVYNLFRGEGTEHDLALAGHQSERLSDEFYALFYLGLYCEVRGEITKASEYMKQALQTEYATSVGEKDYMTSVARVHCQLRGWV
ncbi:hypothetical protein FisN_20Lh112 [Fistulifera solaris]|uniref:Uncharacterized protein n=1 Tax=Fistulifera solaris TaxID=1519565 RepID=A0A1Z5JCV2_FISSO|nr:hypothetical protein FisN_20Lh112 [Fistulifera solaris]|eukprot:GAX11833.1 hypothetical protein FisN_20Lh112 [Fistulifera solaris]